MDLNPIETLFISSAGAAIGTGIIEYLVLISRFKKKLNDKDKEIQKIKSDYKKFKTGVTYWDSINYNILLDGAKGTGKSALVSKWIDPTTQVEEGKFQQTTGIAKVGPVNLCSRFYIKNEKEKREDRHRLTLWDIGGEHLELISDIVAQNKIKACVIVIDPTNPEESFSRFNVDSLKRTYFSQLLLKECRGILIYISKSDLVKKTEIEKIRERVQIEIVPHLQNFYANCINVVVGSAHTGENLQDALGVLAKYFSLEDLFIKHRSLSTEKRDD